jgi:hypothetical protein
MVNPGRPLAMSASTVTGTPARPLVAQLIAHAITQWSVTRRRPSPGCRDRMHASFGRYPCAVGNDQLSG